MDMIDINLLSDQQKEEYAKLMRVFSEPGWQVIVAQCNLKEEQWKEAGANASTWEDNRYALGLRIAYSEFARMEEAVEAVFQQYADQAREAQQVQDEEIYE